VISFIDLGLLCNGKHVLRSGVHVHNRPPTSWASNVPCPPIHHISSNLVVPITYSFHHAPPPTYFPTHPPYKPQTTH